ncbi:hypothetical protein GF319_15165, partial [Candidatus Bathyarchaeota archaeon]|nr:hypothetical protein [Candidatus Bathyarchaeota archaeon]
IVVDSLTTLMFQFEASLERRKAILNLFKALSETGASCIATSEVRSRGPNRVFQTEEFLSHGVINLFSTPDGIRILRIEKMRGIDHDLLPRPYIIGKNGIEVYPKEKLSQSTLSSLNFL